MPNHVINEVVFSDLTPPQAERVIGLVRNQKMQIDFELLLPIPPNCWMGSVGSEHKRVFPNNALDWCAENWSTKWNAYGEHFVDYNGAELTFRFKTAWRPPYGWLCALFNISGLSFEYRFLSEGELDGHVGILKHTPDDTWSSMDWKERTATPEELDRLGVLLWGEEAWKEIQAENKEA